MHKNMKIENIKLVLFDMSGTTIEDKNEVLDCFYEALAETGLHRHRDYINTMMGWSKIEVFRQLWSEEIGKNAADLEFKAQVSFTVFKQHLEAYYAQNPMLPTEGCLETFDWLRAQGIKICLNTGFYRHVVDILLEKMDWKIGRDIDFVIASDEVPRGRPEPFMIRAAMQQFGIHDAQQVIKIGDTPVDLLEGRNAGCHTYGLTNGSHTAEQLEGLDSDGLFDSMTDFLAFLKNPTLSMA
jgi:phosphonatase-like hydrolase